MRFGIGFIIGPALGGLVATFGHRAPFVAAAALAGAQTTDQNAFKVPLVERTLASVLAEGAAA